MFIFKKSLVLLIVLVVGLAAVLAQSKDTTSVYAIRNAKIVTVSGATIEKGTVLIRDGKIVDVGANVSIPANAKIVDATGLSVYPGLIDSGTILGLSEIGQGAPGTVDTNELGDYNANMKALTAVNPNSEMIPVARSNGVTTVLTCPQGGVIAGQCALLNIDGWTNYEMKLKAPAAMMLNYPVAALRSGGGFGGGGFAVVPEALKQQRDRKIEELKKKLEDAQAYLKAREAASKDSALPARAIDLGLEAMIPVLKGEVPVLVSANGEREIKGALELADKFKLKLIISGGDEAGKLAAQLKEKNIPIILGGVLELPNAEDDAYDEVYARAAEFSKAGIKFAFSTSDTPANVRLLPYHAGTAAAFGLPKEEALKAITLYPAQIFGVDKFVGSIETGKIANLIVTDGDPLEFRTKIKFMFINGKQVDLANKHTRLYEKFKDRP